MKLIYCIGLILSFTACSYVKNVRLLTGGYVQKADFVQEIPFEYRKGLIVVKVRINSDTVDREFIFDTGAFNTKIEAGIANELGLKTITTKENSTAQGISQIIEVTRIDSITFGKTKFYNVGAGKLTYAENSASPCIASSGLIGANLIKLANWKIDYKSQKIIISNKPFKDGGKGTLLAFDRPALSATPLVDLTVGGKEVSGLMFDTGFNGGITLPGSLSSNFHVSDSILLIDRSTTGIYGSNTDTLVIKRMKVSLGSEPFEFPVEFSSLGKGLVGNEVFENFTVLINNQENNIQLIKEEEVLVDEPVKFIPGVLNDSLWIVDRMEIPNQYGLVTGDTLVLVNGMNPGGIFTNYCEYFMGIRGFLSADTLEVKKVDGHTIKLR